MAVNCIVIKNVIFLVNTTIQEDAMKHIIYLTVFLVITSLLLTSCQNNTAGIGTDGSAAVSADSSTEPLNSDDTQHLDTAGESSVSESGEDETPKDFVELTPFDIDEKEYRFKVGDTEYLIDLSYYDSESLREFDALEEQEYKTDKVYTEKHPVTSAEESLSYGVEILREYILETESEQTTWLLFRVMRDEANDAWGISFGSAPLRPGSDWILTYYSDGEMISFRTYGE